MNDDIRAYYSRNRVESRMPRLKLSNIKPDDGFPILHGQAIKAANTRHLFPYVLALQRRAVQLDGSDNQRHMLKVVESMHASIELLYSAGHFLTSAEADLLQHHMTRLGRNYQYLATHVPGVFWRQTSKLHYSVAHLAEQARLINPRYVQTYGSEGLVGKVTKIYKASLSGPWQSTIQGSILRKYRTGMMIRWKSQ